MEREIPINEDQAGDFIRSIEDPIVRNLVSMAFANARLEIATGSVPDAPFDMAFFVRLVHMTVKRTDVVRHVLEGKTIAEATGWDL